MSLTILLFDKAPWRNHLLPLSASRPVGNLRVGICTLDEKWQRIFQAPVFFATADYLQPSFPSVKEDHSSTNPSPNNVFLIIQANVLPDDSLLEELDNLSLGEVLVSSDRWIACKLDFIPEDISGMISNLQPVKSSSDVQFIHHPEDIFLQNKQQLAFDFELLTKGRVSAAVSSNNMLFGDRIFIEPGAQVEGVSLNSLDGPIYIGKNAQLKEGSFLRGHVAIGESARVKMMARLYPNVSIGPGSTIAGEVNNTVIWGNSAKGHDGYLGCSVIGEGCNIGAGTSNSNLKNNWQDVRLYDYEYLSYRQTDVLKCGMIMGDLAMLGINSSVNTGTVIGVAAQVAMSNIIPKFVPDFSWQVGDDYSSYRFDKFLDMLERRKLATGTEISGNIAIFEHIYNNTAGLRTEVINNQTKK